MPFLHFCMFIFACICWLDGLLIPFGSSPDDVDEITILLATVSSLLTLGLFKLVCWVIRRIMNKVRGLVDKSVSSSVEKRLARREQELIRRMEEVSSFF
jgi:hypothetical protein